MNYKLWLYLFGFLLLAAPIFGQTGTESESEGESEGEEGEDEGESEDEGGVTIVQSNMAVDYLTISADYREPWPFPVSLCSVYDMTDTSAPLYVMYTCSAELADGNYSLTKQVYSDSGCATIVNDTMEEWTRDDITKMGAVPSYLCASEFEYTTAVNLYPGAAEDSCAVDAANGVVELMLTLVPGTCFYETGTNTSFLYTCSEQESGLTASSYRQPGCNGDGQTIQWPVSGCVTLLEYDADSDDTTDNSIYYPMSLLEGTDNYDCYYVATPEPVPTRDADPDSAIMRSVLVVASVAVLSIFALF